MNWIAPQCVEAVATVAERVDVDAAERGNPEMAPDRVSRVANGTEIRSRFSPCEAVSKGDRLDSRGAAESP